MAIIDPRAVFLRGLEEYHQGRHYEAHEHWEELWQDERDEPRRRFLQALIQIASAVHKARNDVAPRGSLKLLASAGTRLGATPDQFLGIDVAALRLAIGDCSAAIATHLYDDGHCRLPDELVPAIVQRDEVPSWPRQPAERAVPLAGQAAWFDRGLAAYRSRDYFDAHELWEELWREEPNPAEKRFLQGLIQVAAAMHKLVEQGKPTVAARLLGRALAKLHDHVPARRGVDVARLVREAQDARQALLSVDPEGEPPAIAPPTIARL